MKVEEICMRQEIRQLMSECGFTKEKIGDLIREAINAEVKRVVEDEVRKLANAGYITRVIKDEIGKQCYGSIRNEVERIVRGMKMTVDFQFKEEQSNECK